jgi:glycine/D-amino acid oxidase-like deaminating enzyme
MDILWLAPMRSDAGIIGVSVALRLAKRGLAVALIDRGEPARAPPTAMPVSSKVTLCFRRGSLRVSVRSSASPSSGRWGWRFGWRHRGGGMIATLGLHRGGGFLGLTRREPRQLFGRQVLSLGVDRFRRRAVTLAGSNRRTLFSDEDSRKLSDETMSAGQDCAD